MYGGDGSEEGGKMNEKICVVIWICELYLCVSILYFGCKVNVFLSKRDDCVFYVEFIIYLSFIFF